MSTLVRLFSILAAELAGNERLLWGIWIASCLLIVHVIILQFDRLDSIRQDYASSIEHMQKTRALLEQQDMTNLLAIERRIHDTLTSMLWQAETRLVGGEGTAALTKLFGDLGVKSIHFRSGSSRPFPELPGAWQTEIRLDVNYQPESNLSSSTRWQRNRRSCL